MANKTLFFAIITICGFLSTAKGKNCEKLLKTVASTNADYIQCVTNHAAPVNICESCEIDYKAMQTHYTAFHSATDGDEKETKCTDIYIDKDRLNIIAHSNEVLTTLWKEAFCEACFNSNGTINDDTQNYHVMFNKFGACKNASSSKYCSECEGLYNDLNDFYKRLQESYKHNVCFDIQDSMNRTRSAWTKDCGHDETEASLVAFFAVNSVLLSVPILFYCGFFVYGRRSERNQQLLDLPTGQEGDNPITTTNSSDYMHSAPSTSSNIFSDATTPENTAKSKAINNDEDHEDLLL